MQCSELVTYGSTEVVDTESAKADHISLRAATNRETAIRRHPATSV